MDYRELVNLGLSEKEAKVYLAALELGKSPVQKIAQKAEVNRATTYVILESLMKKGLVSTYEESKKQYFCAESPEKLSLLFREQAMAIQRKQEYLDRLLPELRSIKISDKDRPTVRYFEGKEGLRAMAEEFYITEQDEPAKMVYSVDLLNKIFSQSEKLQMRERRLKKQIKTEVIYNYHDNILANTRDGKRVKVNEKQYPIFCDIAIFGNKIRIASLKNKITGIIIDDKEMAITLKSLFRLAWIGARLENKKEAQAKNT